MISRIVKWYILLVLVLLSILPTIYFVIPNFEIIEKTPLAGTNAQYHFISSDDDYELFVRSYIRSDSLPSLLFLADNPIRANAAFEIALIDSLKESFNLYFPDYRSVGKSERMKSFSAYNFEHYSNDLRQIINYFEPSNFTIIGHGFGALIAQHATLLDSTRIEKLILISPISDYDKSAKRSAKRLSDQFKDQQSDSLQVPFYFEMYGYSTEDEVGFFGSSKIFASMEYYKSWFTDTLNATSISLSSFQEFGLYTEDETMAVNLPSITIGLMYSLYKTSFESLYSHFPVKTQILFGEDDTMIDRKFFLEKQADEMLSIDSIPNSAYFPYIENKASFLQKIRTNF